MKTQHDLQLPTVHLNGTSRESLVDALCVASQGIDAAYKALCQTAPNGRDYYPQGPDAMDRATKEHRDRLLRLDAIKDEIDSLTLQISRL